MIQNWFQMGTISFTIKFRTDYLEMGGKKDKNAYAAYLSIQRNEIRLNFFVSVIDS